MEGWTRYAMMADGPAWYHGSGGKSMSIRLGMPFALAFAGILLGCRIGIGTALPFAVCRVYENPLALSQDAEGWTVFSPRDDARIIYVSAATGDDGNARAYGIGDAELGGDAFRPAGAVRAFRSYDAAVELAREGYPDWILFRRGEVHEGISLRPRSGRGETEYALTSSYGTGALPQLRPRLDMPAIDAMSRDPHGFFAITNLDFYNPDHDPANYPPGTMPPEGETGINVFNGSSRTGSILFEGLRFRCFRGNVIQSYESGRVEDIAIRRCVFLDNHSGDRANGHSQGLYAGSVSGFYMEECVFDHNGWYHRDDGDGANELPGEATMFNHNTYFADCRDVTFRGNLFLRASSMGNKFTANAGTAGSSPNIALLGNLYFDGEIGVGLGGNVPTPHKFKGVLVQGNAFTEIGRSRPTNRTLGWGLEVQDWEGGVVRGNLFIHNPHPEVDNTYAIAVVGGVKDLLITDNVVYGQNEAGNNRWGQGLAVDSSFEKENIRVTGNVFQEPTAACVFASLEEGALAEILELRANRYWAPGEDAREACFGVGLELLSFDAWRGLSGDASRFEAAAFPEPSRDISAYQAGPGGGGGREEFIAACRARDRDAWDAAHGAQAVIAWLSAGFGR